MSLCKLDYVPPLFGLKAFGLKISLSDPLPPESERAAAADGHDGFVIPLGAVVVGLGAGGGVGLGAAVQRVGAARRVVRGRVVGQRHELAALRRDLPGLRKRLYYCRK